MKNLINGLSGNVFSKKGGIGTGIFLQGKVYPISRANRYKIQEMFYIFLCSRHASNSLLRAMHFRSGVCLYL
jgi:hypothetical protein